jgi:Tricorn protease C1 domain
MMILPTLIWFSLWLGMTPKTSQTQVPKGLWLSHGYGLLVQFEASELRKFDITSISCIASGKAQRLQSPERELIGTYITGHEIIRIAGTSDPDVVRMHTDGTASDIVLHRTPRLPNSCQILSSNTPEENYAILWQTFAEQYPFFSLHQVDWRAVDKKFRPQVTSATKPTELFEIFRQMIEPLQDAHTGVEAEEIKTEFDGSREDPNHLEESDWKRAESVIDEKYLHGRFRLFCNDHIQFGTDVNHIGYLRVTAFYGYVDDADRPNHAYIAYSALGEIRTHGGVSVARVGGLELVAALHSPPGRNGDAWSSDLPR